MLGGHDPLLEDSYVLWYRGLWSVCRVLCSSSRLACFLAKPTCSSLSLDEQQSHPTVVARGAPEVPQPLPLGAQYLTR